MAKQNNTFSIDVHGLYVDEAMQVVRDKIAKVPKTIEKIVVVHGYNHGTAIKDAMRRLHSPRIREVTPSILNPGETVIWLKR